MLKQLLEIIGFLLEEVERKTLVEMRMSIRVCQLSRVETSIVVYRIE